MKQLSINKTNFVKNGCSPSLSKFRLYPRLKMPFEHNSARKNIFLSACCCWDAKLPMRAVDQLLNLMEPLVKGTRTWNSYFVTQKRLN